MSPNPRAKEYDIYHFRSTDALLRSVGRVQTPENHYINTLLFCTRHNLFEVLSRRTPSNISLRRITGNRQLSSYSLQYHWGRENKHEVSGKFIAFDTAQPNIYLVFSISKSDFWQKGLLRYFDSLYPIGIRPFLKQKELYEIMKSFRESLNGSQLRVKKIVSKGRIISESALKKFDSDITWTDLSLDEAFGKAQEEDKWFKSISFEILEERSARGFVSNVLGRVSKYGWISCNKNYSMFYAGLISPMLEFGNRKFQLFMNRSRRELPNYEVRPIAIDYEFDLFREKIQGQKFISVVRKLSNTSCSVIHSNPFIHLAVVDYLDDSSYEIWVLSTRRILIIPQVKTSEAALRRLCGYIFEEFGEGEIREA